MLKMLQMKQVVSSTELCSKQEFTLLVLLFLKDKEEISQNIKSNFRN